jgi:hypothetical protein
VVQILWRVDADRIVPGFDNFDREAVLEDAQLFERFAAFERSGRQRG